MLAGAGGSATGSGNSGPKYYGPPEPVNEHPTLTRIIESSVTLHKGGAFPGVFIVAKGTPVEDPETKEPLMSIVEGPIDINHHPNLGLLFMVGQGTDNVLVMSTEGDPTRHPVAELKVGEAPKAIAFSEDGTVAYVLNGHGYSVSRVDLTSLFPPDGTAPETVTPQQLVHEAEAPFAVNPLPEEMRAGRRVYFFARNTQVTDHGEFSCNTCHFDGTVDKVTWVGTGGLRQTPTLAGRLKGSEPFNWKGTKDDLKDNMTQTIERMKGTGLSEEQLVSLKLFIEDGIEAPPNPHLSPDGLTPEQQLGKSLFEDPTVGCATCHPDGGTDGKMHDLGTLSTVEQAILDASADPIYGFNTPSLKGVWHTAPYLHDGSVATLDEVLLGGKMGSAHLLAPDERAALVAYLRTL